MCAEPLRSDTSVLPLDQLQTILEEGLRAIRAAASEREAERVRRRTRARIEELVGRFGGQAGFADW
jgi:hypothetical protein